MSKSDTYANQVALAELRRLENEMDDLQKRHSHISQTLKPEPEDFADRVELINEWIEKEFIQKTYEYFYRDIKPTLSDLDLYLRVYPEGNTVHGKEEFRWEIWLPEDHTGGSHRKIVDITRVCEFLPIKRGPFLSFLEKRQFFSKVVVFNSFN